MMKSSNKLPDAYESALIVLATIDGCKTVEHLHGALHLLKNFNVMFEGQWDWVYADEFAEAVFDKEKELYDAER